MNMRGKRVFEFDFSITGWWGALATAYGYELKYCYLHLIYVSYRRVSPFFVRHTIAVVAVGTRPYVEWLAVLHR